MVNCLRCGVVVVGKSVWGRCDGGSCYSRSVCVGRSSNIHEDTYVAGLVALRVECVERMAVIQMRRKIQVRYIGTSGRTCWIPASRAANQPNRASAMQPREGHRTLGLPQCSCSTSNNSPSTKPPAVQPKSQTLQCPSSPQKHALITPSRCTRWYVCHS
jgi:hypothetical protein